MVYGKPLLRSIQELGEAFAPSKANTVSTKLTLGREEAPSVFHSKDAVYKPVAAFAPLQSPSEANGVSHYTSPRGAGYTFVHSVTSSFRRLSEPPDATSRAPSSNVQSSLSSLLQVSKESDPDSAGHVDAHFSELIIDPDMHDWMRLPPSRIYVRPRWLKPLCEELVNAMYKGFATSELTIPERDLTEILRGRLNIFTPKGSVYTIRVTAGQLGSSEARELIVKYHERL